jgi:hypothetical protein
LFDAMSLVILPRPNTGQQSPTTTGPLRRAHLNTTEYPNAALTLRCDQDRRRKLSYRLRDTTRGHRPD